MQSQKQAPRLNASPNRNRLLAATVVLAEEAEDRFLDLLQSFIDGLQPATATQLSLVETMAVARWRLLRIWGVQKAAIDREMALLDPNLGPPSVRIIFALGGSSSSPNPCAPELLMRYEVAYDRQFSRALSRLLQLQSRPRQTEAVPYFPESISGHTWKTPPPPPGGEMCEFTERTQQVVEIAPSHPHSAPRPAPQTRTGETAVRSDPPRASFAAAHSSGSPSNSAAHADPPPDLRPLHRSNPLKSGR